ncbi:MAG: hypothetical protein LBV03_07250 [Fusobacteriales bacterium]|jgi:hypothetical protein|nr:hypothetical protein [Fusobacteriales bacterium]
MARETTVEVDIEVSTKYSEKIKKAEERLKKVNKVASKMNTPKKPLTEMEKYQQSIYKTNKLLQKLEKQQRSIGKLTQIETILKAKVKITITESEKKQTSLNSNSDKKKEDKNWFEKGADIADNIEKYWTLYDRISGLFSGKKKKENSNIKTEDTSIKTSTNNSQSSSENTCISEGKKDKGWFEKGADIADNIEKYWTLYDRISGLFNKKSTGQNNNNDQEASTGMTGLLSLNTNGMLTQLPAIGSKAIAFFTGIGSKISGVLSAMFASNPVGLVIVGIIAAIAVFVLLYKKCEWFRNGVNKIFNAIKPYIVMIGNFIKQFIIFYIKFLILYLKIVVQVFKFVWNTVKAIVATVFNVIVQIIKTYILIVKSIIETIVIIFQTVWNAIKAVIDFVISLIIAGITLFIDTIKIIIETVIMVFQTVWDTVLLIITLAIEFITSIISAGIEIITFIINGIVAVFTFIWEQIGIIVQGGIDFITGLWDTVTTKVSEVWGVIVSGISGFMESIKSTVGGAVDWVKGKFSEIIGSIPFLDKILGGGGPGKKYSGTNFWKGGLTYVGERGRELIQYPTGERFMAEAKMLMNLPKGTQIFTNSKTEKMLNKNVPKEKMMTVDENNQLKKLGGFNGLSDYADFKFGGGINYSNVQTDNITINITNTYGNQSSTQIKDTNNDLIRKINEVLFQKEDRKRRVSIG